MLLVRQPTLCDTLSTTRIFIFKRYLKICTVFTLPKKMIRQSSFWVFLTQLLWFNIFASTNATTTGPLTQGGFLVSSVLGSSEQNSPINVSVTAMTAQWTINTTFSNIPVDIETIYGNPTVVFQDTFDNSGVVEFIQNYSHIEQAYNYIFLSGATTNMSTDCSVAAKGSNCSAKLTGGLTSHRRGPYHPFGANYQVKRYGAYMRTCCTSQNGPYLALLQENSTGTFLVVSAYFDGVGVLRLRRSDVSGNPVYSPGLPFLVNTWYRVDVILDWSARTSELWVNGAFVTGNFPLYPSVVTASGINMYNYDNTTGWIDEIEVVAQDDSLVVIPSLISPYPVIMQNGIWNGTVTVQQQANNATIKASYQTVTPQFYVEGLSNSFSVTAPSPSPSASITPSSSISPGSSASVTPSFSPSPSSTSPSPSSVHSPGQNKTPKPNNSAVIVASSVVVTSAVLGGILVAAFFIRRRRPGAGRQRAASVDMSLKPMYAPCRTDSQDRLEIDYKEISLGPEIGRGAFGSVYKARWRNCDCVVKQLNVENKEIAIKEAQTTRALRPHKNVCTMFGICTNPEFPICIVMEFVEGGTLKDLVYSPLKVELDGLMAVSFAKDVVSGMTHIHRENILHCDLACRNLLVQKSDKGYTVKVTDFGLSRVTESGIYDANQEAKFPIRWSAPEVLTERKVSRASDVWSFGIVLWEILEGKMPYYDLLNNAEVIEMVCNQHQVPPRPNKRFPYPDDLYDVVMESCWKEDPSERPTFDHLFALLDEIEQKYGKKQSVEDGIVVIDSTVHEYTSFENNNDNSNNNPDAIYGNQNN